MTLFVLAVSTWNIGTSIRLTQFGSKVYDPTTNREFDIAVVKDGDFVLDIIDFRHERSVIESILERSKSHMSACESFGASEKLAVKKKDFNTGVLPLPEFGAVNAIQKWFNDTSDSSKINHNVDQASNYPTCYLPPSQICDAESFSVIFMSHSLERLGKLNEGIENIAKWSRVAEIVLVWNSDRNILEKGKEKKNKKAILLLQWNEDKSHPLRIFFSLEHGLTNNLMNRYHPLVKPSQEAMLFFDDDGPFFSELAMDAGFDLWKRNSDIQVGSFPRNIRFKSKRMIKDQKETSMKSVEYVGKGNKNVHPNDILSINKINDQTGNHLTYPPFTPFCHSETNEVVEYNYFVFPSHTAHMLLPSGSFLHRNYTCFIWHPVFEEIREYILVHPTHPDDITISTLVSQLSGRAPRTFPRIVKGEKQPSPKSTNNESKDKIQSEIESKKILSDKTKLSNKLHQDSREKVKNVNLTSASQLPPQVRRKLLWQQKNWGEMREEAINSIAQYFGNINQGSVGWCAGTKYQTEEKKLHHTCKPEFPDYNMIPWVRTGGPGNDHC